MNITVEDCARDVCAPVQAVVSAAFLKMSADISPNPESNLAYPVEGFNPGAIPQVILMGKSPKTTTFNYVGIPSVGFDLMRSKYGTSDDHELAVNEVSSSVNVAGVTALPTATLNADFIGPNFTAATQMRQFAVLLRITFPQTVYRVTFAVTAPQSPIVETMTVEFTDTECRELNLLCIQCSRSRFVTAYGVPNVAASLNYVLPYGIADCEAPGSGAIETLTVATFDDTGAAVAATIQVLTWNIPYSAKLTDALMAYKGIASPGARSAYQATPASFAIENAQPVY